MKIEAPALLLCWTSSLTTSQDGAPPIESFCLPILLLPTKRSFDKHIFIVDLTLDTHISFPQFFVNSTCIVAPSRNSLELPGFIFPIPWFFLSTIKVSGVAVLYCLRQKDEFASKLNEGLLMSAVRLHLLFCFFMFFLSTV